jgi:hypothetical protein
MTGKIEMSDITMTEEQKLIAEIAARLLVANIARNGMGRDSAHAHNAVVFARQIVEMVKG